mmetsp:Transcript_32029/g.91951  ORF Transcript_32029/g.91951 Transcript_32029/m.91951 type:complete len:284 (+) Transcript_32029:74-925(+)
MGYQCKHGKWRFLHLHLLSLALVAAVLHWAELTCHLGVVGFNNPPLKRTMQGVPRAAASFRDQSAWPSSGSSMRFSHFANWLLPERLLAGRYPYVNPGYCESSKEADEQLITLLQDAKVSTFVCLQAELPPQQDPRSWPPRGVRVPGFPGRFLPYATRVQELAAAMGCKVHFVHEPITDLGVPSQEQLSSLLEQLENLLLAGEVVYLHCWGGRGRTGLVAACLLGKLFPDRAADDCLDLVQSAYSSRGDHRDVGQLALSPQTREQRDFVRDRILLMRSNHAGP